MAVIEVEGLRKEYRSRRGRTLAVDGLDLVVPEGGVFAFLGPNGAGKTTTIRCLLGLVRPTAGKCRLLGAETPQAALDCCGHPPGTCAGVAGVVVDRRDELRRDEHLVATAAERTAEELLGARPAVDVGRVEEVDTGIEGSIDHRRALLLVDAHPEVVASEPDQRDLE